jgi:hypothetical protein
MRDEWFGDKRDLVKWTTLPKLAERHRLRHILQVLYFRTSNWHHLEIDGSKVEIPTSVIAQFRDVRSIRAMKCDPVIDVLDEEFQNSNRSGYLRSIEQHISRRSVLPGIVFLDPDTGLEPSESAKSGLGHRCKAKSEHVCEIELANIWSLLVPGDVLVLYQHAIHEKNWRERKRQQFSGAIGIDDDRVGTAKSDKLANDVAFFYARKD